VGESVETPLVLSKGRMTRRMGKGPPHNLGDTKGRSGCKNKPTNDTLTETPTRDRGGQDQFTLWGSESSQVRTSLNFRGTERSRGGWEEKDLIGRRRR